MVEPYIPDQGDIIFANFSPQAGKEQSGRRPGIVLTPKMYNEKTGLLICCPITSKIKGYEFEVTIPDINKTQGVILSDHVRSIDWIMRKAEFFEKIDARTLATVLRDVHQLTELQ